MNKSAVGTADIVPPDFNPAYSKIAGFEIRRDRKQLKQDFSFIPLKFLPCHFFPGVETPDHNIGRAYGTEAESSAIGTTDFHLRTLVRRELPGRIARLKRGG